MEKSQRLDKILVHMGIGSRRDIKALCKAGAVQVDGRVVKDPSLHVYPSQNEIKVEGEQIQYQEFFYFMMHKPQGVISATEDPRHRTVIDLLEVRDQRKELFPVGRLDIDTEGLLLLTNDGQLAHQLLSPKKKVPKVYYAKIAGVVTEADQQAMAQGVVLEAGYQTMPADLKILKSAAISEVELTIHEGKFHQVKRMFEALEKRVIFLKRLTMGPLVLDEALALGEYRPLTEEELQALGIALEEKSAEE